MADPILDLHDAALAGDVEGIRTALDQGADINARTPTLGDTALHLAVMKQHLEATHVLLDAGARPSVQNGDGRTPLHEAAFAFQKQPELWRDLVAHGANVDLPDMAGRTPEQLKTMLVWGPAMVQFSQQQGERALDHERSR